MRWVTLKSGLEKFLFWLFTIYALTPLSIIHIRLFQVIKKKFKVIFCGLI